MSLWTAFWFAIIVIPVVVLWVYGLIDVFRRKDLSSIAKVLWALFIILLPILGVIVYHYIRPDSALADTVPSATQTFRGGKVPQDLSLLGEMHQQGKLSDAEYEAAKRKIVGSD